MTGKGYTIDRPVFQIATALLVGAVAGHCADGPTPPPTSNTARVETGFPLEVYRALGVSMARESHLPEVGWNQARVNAFLSGVTAAFQGQAGGSSTRLPELKQQLDSEIQSLELRKRRAALASPSGLRQFLKNIRKEASLRETDSGLCYRVLKPGTGVHPRPQDAVVLSFDCRTADDMSLVPSVRADHLRVKVADLLPGLSEGLQMLTIDGELLVVLPPDLSFRDGPWPTGVAPGLPLAFVLKLHEVIPAR